MMALPYSAYNADHNDHSNYSDYDDYDDTGEAALPCADKIAFDTQRQAAAAANVADYQHGTSVRPYRCRYCGLWHLASS